MGQREAQQLAAAIHSLAEKTDGAGNFRFGASFNCMAGIPYFPAATAGPGCSGFAIGTENSALLHEAFQQAAADAAAVAAGEGAPGSDGSVLYAAQACLRSVMTVALQPLEELVQQLAAGSGRPYLGIDASIAPALEPPSIPSSYELLRLGRFGGCGTLAISGWLHHGAASTNLCWRPGLVLRASQYSTAAHPLTSTGALCHCHCHCRRAHHRGAQVPSHQAVRLQRPDAACVRGWRAGAGGQ